MAIQRHSDHPGASLGSSGCSTQNIRVQYSDNPGFLAAAGRMDSHAVCSVIWLETVATSGLAGLATAASSSTSCPTCRRCFGAPHCWVLMMVLLRSYVANVVSYRRDEVDTGHWLLSWFGECSLSAPLLRRCSPCWWCKKIQCRVVFPPLPHSPSRIPPLGWRRMMDRGARMCCRCHHQLQGRSLFPVCSGLRLHYHL